MFSMINTTSNTAGRIRAKLLRRLGGAAGAAAGLALVALVSAPTSTMAQSAAENDVGRVHYGTVKVDGIEIFYREAGDPSRPTLLLLHGFPSSSHMFRSLMPLLSYRFHLVAPDYPGSGFSEAPAADRFEPTFANLARVMAAFVQAKGLATFTIYMHDFGGPVGFRMAAAHPEWVSGLVIQNANAYEAGIARAVLDDMKVRAAGPLNAEATRALDGMLSAGGTKFQYVTGARDPSSIDPTSYSVDAWIQAMPEHRRIQKALIVDYHDNLLQYPAWHRYLRQHRPKALVVWGKNDPIFLPAGADAYRADLPQATVRFFDTGHFALEEDSAAIAAEILRFLPSE